MPVIYNAFVHRILHFSDVETKRKTRANQKNSHAHASFDNDFSFAYYRAYRQNGR